MQISHLIRQTHRWLSICFTAGVVVNAVVIWGLAVRQPPFWIYLLVLVPLFLLLFTGLYLFALPYAVRWTSARRTRALGARP